METQLDFNLVARGPKLLAPPRILLALYNTGPTVEKQLMRALTDYVLSTQNRTIRKHVADDIHARALDRTKMQKTGVSGLPSMLTLSSIVF